MIRNFFIESAKIFLYTGWFVGFYISISDEFGFLMMGLTATVFFGWLIWRLFRPVSEEQVIKERIDRINSESAIDILSAERRRAARDSVYFREKMYYDARESTKACRDLQSERKGVTVEWGQSESSLPR
ncbi:hypothetical protein A3709_18885 [Halioglobus sp. HI00S01]|uniref:hypothetical protein n=1 Tax=Halioglobus sp. HI00S01 TaxID=1822214 RepID=UPI0007C3A4DE|nr:hypothetical protein [Halioglobus sp. HI00S01]KZX57691.1 hypothetical protein A3709_18885 [Halioglobus sp. HI00S01]